MNKTISIILIVICGCSATQKNIIGKYTNHENFEVGAEINLLEDNRFNYSAQQGLMFFATKGTWKLIDRYVLLNSDTSLIDSSYYQFKTPINSDSIDINVHFGDGKLPGAVINAITKSDTLEFRTDIDGLAKIPSNNVRSLHISYIYLLPVKIKLNQQSLKNIDVFMIDDIVGNMEFVNEKLLIKPNRLIEINKNSNRRIVYKKVDNKSD